MNVNDTCPSCCKRDVPPHVDAEDYDGNPHSAYRCPACRHTWLTVRRTDTASGDYATYDDPDAWEADDDFSDYDRARGWSGE